MLGVAVKGPTYLFSDNKSMVTNMSIPHYLLKRRHSANNYHQVKEVVAAGIASVIHCSTKYNLADMGTKPLNRMVHQFLLHNQNFPPVEIVGECEQDTDGDNSGNPNGLT
eukprot:11160836-Ditylum_brightwellii.AAC.1